MTVILYFLALLAVGAWCRHTTRDGAGFFLAGRGLSAAEVGISLAATGFGGSALLVATTLVYTRGLGGYWFSGAIALGLIVLGLAMAARVRASGAHSLADYVRRLGGPTAGRIASMLLVVIQVAFFAISVKSFALVCVPLLGAEHWLLRSPVAFQIGVSLVFVGYTLLGGHKAVALTDILQLGLIGAVLCGVLLPTAVARADWAALPVGFLEFPWTQESGPWFFLNMLCMAGLSGVVGGDIFSKLLSARNERAARRGALLGGVLLALLAAMVVTLALAARTLLPELDESRMQLAIPLLARELLAPALFQLASVALLSVLLSTADSVLITGATVLTLDVLRRPEAAAAGAERWLTLALAAMGVALALAHEQVLGIMTFGYTLLTASLVAPTIIATFAPRAGGRALPWAMLAGLATATAWAAVFDWAQILPATDVSASMAGVAVSAATMGLGVLLAPAGDAAAEDSAGAEAEED